MSEKVYKDLLCEAVVLYRLKYVVLYGSSVLIHHYACRLCDHSDEGRITLVQVDFLMKTVMKGTDAQR